MRPTGGRNWQLIHHHCQTCYNGSTVVEHSTHNRKKEGSNPGTCIEEMAVGCSLQLMQGILTEGEGLVQLTSLY
jgi:hypothetical protein